MQLDEFIEATGRMEIYYGKELTTEQMQIMFEELKYLNIESYKKLISKCLKTCKYMPKIADIIEANINLAGEVKKEVQREKICCNKCDGTGYVFYTVFMDNGNTRIPHTYAARCDCKNAIYANSKVPSINELGIQISSRINQIKDTTRSIEYIKKDLIQKVSF